MGAIEDVYADLDADVSLEEFREVVEEKVEQMGGLADEETAAMLVAHEMDEEGGEVESVADIEPGMEEVKFVAKVVGVDDVRTFERDDEDREDGRVLNVEVADETGSIRITFWDKQADAGSDELEVGDTLRVAGRPKEGYNGVEVNVDKAEPDDETDVDVQVRDTYRVEDLSLGLSDVNLRGKVLDTDDVRTFDRDDGSEGKVANLKLGDSTGRIRVTLWDERTEHAEEFAPGVSVEVVDGYVRERDGSLELHVGNRGAVEEIDEDVEYVPDTADIADLEIGDEVDVGGVVRETQEKRTFDRDDGSEGQVRNIRVQDETGDLRVALWGEKADEDIAPGDEVQLADIEIQDGWQDDIEGSAGWRSTVTVLGEAAAAGGVNAGSSENASGGDSADDGGSSAGLGAFGGDGDDGGPDAAASGSASDGASNDASEYVEFTGTVVQAGDPIILDDGQETVSVDSSADVTLGQKVTARGELHDGTLDAEDVF
ncbi:single-stranded DNA binding protein [Halorussus caseinilyticus]|uniref:single-stranded DNA binding protein n=1 Tax=Halorussus caseinilyticus TaxID=3034025 RepID=UPI0023E8008E|nr:single-stranded DNA binding protein [Halorussus sp. DT72]